MATLDFPDSPTVGEIYDRWTWTGTSWAFTGGAVNMDTRGFTFYQDAQPTSSRAGDTWYHPSTGQSYVWTGSAWVEVAAEASQIAAINTKIDNSVAKQAQCVRARWHGNLQNYPGTNGPLYYHSTTYNEGGGLSIMASGYQILVSITGIYTVTYEVEWSLSAAGVNAAWLERWTGEREASSTILTHPTSNLISVGQSTVRASATEWFAVRVYSTNPPQIASVNLQFVLVVPL